jgi:hypothetical protein
MRRRLQQIDESIERYLGQIASADRQEAAIAEPKTKHLQDKIKALKQEMARVNTPPAKNVRSSQVDVEKVQSEGIENACNGNPERDCSEFPVFTRPRPFSEVHLIVILQNADLNVTA